MYKIDSSKTYRLADVTDHNGNTKINSHPKYERWIGRIAKNIRVDRTTFEGTPMVRMEFVQDKDGMRIRKSMHTSEMHDITLHDNGRIDILTRNSVYILEPAEIKSLEPFDGETPLIELRISDNVEFRSGIYYDSDNVPHELACRTHVGTFKDSCLIYLAEEQTMDEIVCRYFPKGNEIEFYDTLYGQQDYSVKMLIHNESDVELKVSFENFDAVRTIPAGGKKSIIPYDSEGADSDDEEQKED